MVCYNYLFNAHIEGGGNAGKCINSLLRVKLEVDEDDYEPTINICSGQIKLYGNRFSVEMDKSGKDWGKYFEISQDTRDGWTNVCIKKLTQYDTDFTRLQCSTRAKELK